MKPEKEKEPTKVRQPVERKGRRGRFLYWLFTILFVIAGAGVLFYPTISDQWNLMRDKQLENHYIESVQNTDPEEFAKIYEVAEAYNNQHTFNTISNVFEETGEYVISHPYDTMLDPMGNGVMGFLSIPKIKLEIPILHGTGEAALEQGAGHIEGTSLPIGGPGTHAVLAAHRGLPSAMLFTDLDQMREGDRFFLTVLDQKLAYQVDQIKTVLPSETDDLAIAEGEDYVTLLTCTPYGVNTHRLLVRGRRIPYSEADQLEEKGKAKIVNNHSLPTRALLLGLGVLLLLILLFLLLRWLRERRERKR